MSQNCLRTTAPQQGSPSVVPNQPIRSTQERARNQVQKHPAICIFPVPPGDADTATKYWCSGVNNKEGPLLVMFLLYMYGEPWILKCRMGCRGHGHHSPGSPPMAETADRLFSFLLFPETAPSTGGLGSPNPRISRFSSSHCAQATPAPVLCLPGKGECWEHLLPQEKQRFLHCTGCAGRVTPTLSTERSAHNTQTLGKDGD